MKKAVLLLMLLAILVGCEFSSVDYQAIEYRVTGSTATADLVYQNGRLGTSLQSGVIVPWSLSFMGNPRSSLFISAQKDDNPATNVTVTIYANGNVFATSTVSGAKVTATADGTL